MEFHKMTLAEFAQVAAAQKLGPNHGREWQVMQGEEFVSFAEGRTPEDALRMAHKNKVNNALYDNMPDAVRPPGMEPKSMPPARVLGEYPDLQTKFAPAIEAHRRTLGAYQQAIHRFVAKGGQEMDAYRILDSEMTGDVSPKSLADALVFHGFADAAEADSLAAAIIAEDARKILDKEDRKASEMQEMRNPARVLVVVQGGVAECYADPLTEVIVFDMDDYEDDPQGIRRLPPSFRDLAAQAGIPGEAIEKSPVRAASSVYQGYMVRGLRTVGVDERGRQVVEINESEPDFWSLYGICEDDTEDWLEDFSSLEDAQKRLHQLGSGDPVASTVSSPDFLQYEVRREKDDCWSLYSIYDDGSNAWQGDFDSREVAEAHKWFLMKHEIVL